MKRKLTILAACFLMAMAASAQTVNDDDPPCCLFSTIEAGASLQYGHDFAHRHDNLGADLRFVFGLPKVFRLRALANVDGFIPNGFDRKGTALVGLSAEYKMGYCFADFGVSYNPSSRQRINPDAEAGLGLRYAVADRHHLFAETGFNFTANGLNVWHGDYFLKLGYTYTIKTLP